MNEKRIFIDGTIVKARFDAAGQMHWCSDWSIVPKLADCGWVTLKHHRDGSNATTVVLAH